MTYKASCSIYIAVYETAPYLLARVGTYKAVTGPVMVCKYQTVMRYT